MSQLTLASVNTALDRHPSAQWAHDIRNALAVTTLHLETLERLSGPAGRKAANAAHTVMMRAATMCDASLADARQPDRATRRRGFDLIKTIDEVAAVLAPVVPAGFTLETPAESRCMVLADPGDVYRIVFNLVQNAVAVARAGGPITHAGIAISRSGSSVTVRIYDDGPGLPESIRAKIFRRHNGSTTGGNGLGIAIARELAERNGGTLRLAAAAKGTAFVFELTCLHAVAQGTPDF